jgi:hypothetical protein
MFYFQTLPIEFIQKINDKLSSSSKNVMVSIFYLF